MDTYQHVAKVLWGAVCLIALGFLLALLTGCPVEPTIIYVDGGYLPAPDAAIQYDPEPQAFHLPPHVDPEVEDDWMDEPDAGEPEVCGWADMGNRSIEWCDGEQYHCCTSAELDGPLKHWRPKVCPDFCEPGFVAMEDFHVYGAGAYQAALYCVEDKGQCEP